MAVKSKPTPDFTIDALQAELEAVLIPEGAGSTTRELSKLLGIGTSAVLTRLHQMKEDGRLAVVRKRVESIDGRAQLVPAYRLKNKQADEGGAK